VEFVEERKKRVPFSLQIAAQEGNEGVGVHKMNL
jgi:hypothetical protein